MRRWARRCTGARARPTSPAVRPSRAATCSSGSCSTRSTCSYRCCADPGRGGRAQCIGRSGPAPCLPLLRHCLLRLGFVHGNAPTFCMPSAADNQHCGLGAACACWAASFMLLYLPQGAQAAGVLSGQEGAIAQLSSMQTMGAHSFGILVFLLMCCMISSGSPVACCQMALLWPKRRAVIAGEMVLE